MSVKIILIVALVSISFVLQKLLMALLDSSNMWLLCFNEEVILQ